MNALPNGTVEANHKPPAVIPAKPIIPVTDDGPLKYLMDTSRFEHMQRIAQIVAVSNFAPAHIKGKTEKETIGNCFRVVNQAVRWGMDPFAVIDETYVVKGRLGYQGKLIAGVVNARAGLKGGLQVVYNTKSGDAFAAVIFGSDREIGERWAEHLLAYAEEEDRAALAKLVAAGILAVRVSVAQAKTDNQMWRTDPEQKLFYSGVTKWARRHRPEILLGVLTVDDLDVIRFRETAAGRALPAQEETVPQVLGLEAGGVLVQDGRQESD